MEKSREATDAANIRSAYAEVQTAALTEANDIKGVTRAGDPGEYTFTATVTPLKQTRDEWQSGAQEIGGITLAANTAKSGGTATIVYSQKTDATTITIE